MQIGDIKGKVGYPHHPETKRWVESLNALFVRHKAIVEEMIERGSPLDQKLAEGQHKQTTFINTISKQKEMLKNKPCECLT